MSDKKIRPGEKVQLASGKIVQNESDKNVYVTKDMKAYVKSKKGEQATIRVFKGDCKD